MTPFDDSTINCRLTRLASTHHNLRTDRIVGHCEHVPTLGERFIMTAKALDPAMRDAGGTRYVRTTPVYEVECDASSLISIYHFKTTYSVYELEVVNGLVEPIVPKTP